MEKEALKDKVKHVVVPDIQLLSDYFFRDIGVNIVSLDFGKKGSTREWKIYQTEPMAYELYEEQKNQGHFEKGYGIITGKIHRGEHAGKYLVCLDIDNKIGIQEYFLHFEEFKNIDELSQETLVVQHEDAREESAHIYFLTEKPITPRSGSALNKKSGKDVPIIEIKSNSSGYMVGPGSTHENEHPYIVIGTKKIKVLNLEQSDKLEFVLNEIYREYGFENENESEKGIFNKSNLPNDLRFIAQTLEIGSPNYIINIGERDSTLLSFANSLLSRHRNSKKLAELKKFFFEVNENLCEEPLSNSQLEKIWRQSTRYMLAKNSNEKDLANKGEEKKTKPKIEYITYKYTLESRTYESVLIRGIPYFISINEGEVQLVEKIEQESRILRPPYSEEYPYPSHHFENKDEIIKFVRMINEQNIDIDSLFFKIREYATRFVVHKDYVLDYISSLILFSYFQDKSATVPYTMFVGDNESGKSSIGDTFEVLAYRNINMTDPTTANLFRIFGTIEPGQCTLALDEAEKIDEDKDMLSILKTGYQYGKRVQRINQFGKQEHFHTYGLKIMLAERTPVISKAKGVLERTFVISTFNGKPELEVKKVKNPQNKSHNEISKELEFLRKTLLIYRLFHFGDQNVEIISGLEGRNKELCDPILRLFFETNALSRIEYAFERLLDEKSNRKASSLERETLEVIVELFAYYPDGKLPFARLWSNLSEKLGGTLSDSKPQEMSTDGYGILYKQTISKTLRDRFGATDPTVRAASERCLQFDVEKGKQYLKDYRKSQSLSIRCHPVIRDSSDSNDSSRKDPFSNFFYNNHISNNAALEENTNINHSELRFDLPEEDSTDKTVNTAENWDRENNEIATIEPSNAVIAVTLVTNTTLDKNYFTSTKQNNRENNYTNLYRKWKGGDTWACQNCRLTGDKWFMQKHLCRGNIKLT